MPQDLLGWLSIVDVLANVLVAFRLSFGGLFRAYPALYIQVLFTALMEIVALLVTFDRASYGRYYILNMIGNWALWIAIVMALYRTTLGLHRGLATMGRRVVIAGLVATALFLASTLHVDFSHITPQTLILTPALAVDRALTTALALLVLALCGFLNWFVIPTRRNTTYLCLGFGIVFAVRSATSLLVNAVGTPLEYPINVASTAINAGIFLAWAAVLSPAGERQVSFVARNPSPREVEAAVARLGRLTSHLRG